MKKYLLTATFVLLVLAVAVLTALLLLGGLGDREPPAQPMSPEGVSVFHAEKTPPPITHIEIKNGSMNLKPGEVLTVDILVYPSDADTSNIKITSSNDGVARIVNGRVEAVADGQAVISASADSGVSSSCNIRVKAPYEVKGKLTIGTYELSNGQTIEYFSEYRDHIIKYFELTSYQRDNWIYEEDGQYVSLSGTVVSVSTDGKIEVNFRKGSSGELIYAYLTLTVGQHYLLNDIAEGERIEAFARIDAHSFQNAGLFTNRLYFTLYDCIIISRNSSYTEIPADYIPIVPIR